MHIDMPLVKREVVRMEYQFPIAYTQHSPPARKGKVPRPNRVAPSEQIGLARLQVCLLTQRDKEEATATKSTAQR